MSASRGAGSRLSRKRKKEEGSQSQLTTALNDITDDFEDFSTVFRLPKKSKVEKLIGPTRSRGRPPKKVGCGSTSSRCNSGASQHDEEDFTETFSGIASSEKSSQDVIVEEGNNFLEIDESFLCENEKLCGSCKHIVPADIYNKHLKECLQRFKNEKQERKSVASTSKDVPLNTSDQENKNPQEIVDHEKRKILVVLPCPVCLKSLKSQNHRQSHIKSCALKHGLTTEKLLEAVHLQEKQVEERLSLGLSPLPSNSKDDKQSGTTAKRPKRHCTTVSSTKDPDLAMAIALSRSVAEEEAEKRASREEQLLALGLDHIVEEDRKAKPVVLLPCNSGTQKTVKSKDRGRGKGKRNFAKYILATRSSTERERIISEKVALILTAETSSSDNFRKNPYVGARKRLSKFRDENCSLWNSAHDNEEKPLQEYYVEDLAPFIKPKKAEVGRLLRRLSDIPGRLNVTMMQKLDENSGSESDGEGEEESVLDAYCTQLVMAELLGSQELNMTHAQEPAAFDGPSVRNDNLDPNITMEPASGFWLELPEDTAGAGIDVRDSPDAKTERENDVISTEVKGKYVSDSVIFLSESKCAEATDKKIDDNVEHSEISSERGITSVIGQEYDNLSHYKMTKHLDIEENRSKRKHTSLTVGETDKEGSDFNDCKNKYNPLASNHCLSEHTSDKNVEPCINEQWQSDVPEKEIDIPIRTKELCDSEDSEIVCVHDTSVDKLTSSSLSKSSSCTSKFIQSEETKTTGKVFQKKTSQLEKAPDANADLEVVLSPTSSDSDNTEIFDDERNMADAQNLDDDDFAFNELLSEKVNEKNIGTVRNDTKQEERKNVKKSKTLSRKLSENFRKDSSSSSLQSQGVKTQIINEGNKVGRTESMPDEAHENAMEGCESDAESETNTIKFDDNGSESDGGKTIEYDGDASKHKLGSESDEDGAKTILFDKTENLIDSESEESVSKTILYDEGKNLIVNSKKGRGGGGEGTDCESEDGTKTILYDEIESMPSDCESEDGAKTVLYEESDNQVENSESDEEDGAMTIIFEDSDSTIDYSENIQDARAKTTTSDTLVESLQNRQKSEVNEDLNDTLPYQKDKLATNKASKTLGKNSEEKKSPSSISKFPEPRRKELEKSCQRSVDADMDETKLYLSDESPQTGGNDMHGHKHSDENSGNISDLKLLKQVDSNEFSKSTPLCTGDDPDETIPFEEYVKQGSIAAVNIKRLGDVSSGHEGKVCKIALTNTVGYTEESVSVEDDIYHEETLPCELIKNTGKVSSTTFNSSVSFSDETMPYEEYIHIKKILPHEKASDLGATHSLRAVTQDNKKVKCKENLPQSREDSKGANTSTSQESCQIEVDGSSSFAKKIEDNFIGKSLSKSESILSSAFCKDKDTLQTVHQNKAESLILQADHIDLSPCRERDEISNKSSRISNISPLVNIAQKRSVTPRQTKATDHNTKEPSDNSLHERLVYDWSALFASGEESDVTVAVDDEQELNAHSVVFLARCSELYAEIKKSNKKIKWKGVSYEGAYVFLVYLYSGKCCIETKDDPLWMDVFDLALKYNCEELVTYLESLYKNSGSVMFKEPLPEGSKMELSVSKLVPESLASTSKESRTFQTSTMLKSVKPNTFISDSALVEQTSTENKVNSSKDLSSSYITPKISKKNELGRNKIVRRFLDLSPIAREMKVCSTVERFHIKDGLGSKTSTGDLIGKKVNQKSVVNESQEGNKTSPCHESKSMARTSRPICSSQSPDLFESSASIENVSFITTPPKSPLSISTLQSAVADSALRRSSYKIIPKVQVANNTSVGLSVNQDIQSGSRTDELSSKSRDEKEQQFKNLGGSRLLDDDLDDEELSSSVKEKAEVDETESVNEPVELDCDSFSVDDNPSCDTFSVDDNPNCDTLSVDNNPNCDTLSVDNNPNCDTLSVDNNPNCDTLSVDDNPGVEADDENDLIDLTNEDSDDSLSSITGVNNDIANSEEDMEPLKLADSENSSKETSNISYSHNTTSDQMEIVEKDNEIAVDIICPSPKSVISMSDNCEDLGNGGVESENGNEYISNVWDDFDDGGCGMLLDFQVSPAKDNDDDDTESKNEKSLSVENNVGKDSLTNNDVASDCHLSPNASPSSSICSSSPSKIIGPETTALPSRSVSNQKSLPLDGDSGNGGATISDDTMAKIQHDFDDTGLWREEFEPVFEEEEEQLEQGHSSKGDECHRKGTQRASKGTRQNFSKTPRQKPKSKKTVTPMPNYKEMLSPELKGELKKYGIKPISRNKAVLMLEHVYEKTHPLVTDSEAESSYCETPKQVQPANSSRGGKTRKASATHKVVAKNQKKNNRIAAEVTRKATVPVFVKENTMPSQPQINIQDQRDDDDDDESPLNCSQSSSVSQYRKISSEGSERDCVEESMLLEAGDDITGTQRGDLTDQVTQFITTDPELHRKVLLYEPFFVEDLHASLKANGVKCALGSVIEILDNQCITFRTRQGQRQRQRGRQCKRKSTATPNKSPRKSKRGRV